MTSDATVRLGDIICISHCSTYKHQLNCVNVRSAVGLYCCYLAK